MTTNYQKKRRKTRAKQRDMKMDKLIERYSEMLNKQNYCDQDNSFSLLTTTKFVHFTKENCQLSSVIHYNDSLCHSQPLL